MNEITNAMLPASQERRELLRGVLAVTAAVASSAILAEDSEHHHAPAANANEVKNQTLIDAALSCVKNGQLCSAHCIDLIKSGDTSTAQCLAAVTQMLTMCNALLSLSASQSKYLPALAKICMEVCEDCEKECRKHEEKHAACKACADSCANCVKECKKVTA